MTAYRKIDIDSWKRKDQFTFFKDFDQPFFNVVANVDITKLLTYSKKEKRPFFFTSLYAVLKAINSIPEFRLRWLKNDLVEYKTVHSGVTVLTEEKTFLYCTVLYEENIEEFIKSSQEAVEKQKAKKEFIPHGRVDVVYVSVLPWVSFTGFQHARHKDASDAIPRVVLGKYFEENGQYKMPISIEVHHALADGYHVGQFFNNIQKLIDSEF